jgi:hypothetical protein
LINLGDCMKIVSGLKLILVATILKHIFVILEVSWLEILFKSLSSICSIERKAINWWFLGFSKRSLSYSIIYCWSLFEDLAIKYIFSFICLIKSVFNTILFLSTKLDSSLIIR